MAINVNFCPSCGEPNNPVLGTCHKCGGAINPHQKRTQNGISVFSSREFMAATREGQPSQWSTAHWEGLPFQCVCGKPHNFSQNKVQVLKSLPKARLIFACPEGTGMVVVHPKGILRITGFESLFGTFTIENVIDVSAVVTPEEDSNHGMDSAGGEATNSNEEAKDPIEQELEDLYVEMYQRNFGHSFDAREMVRGFLEAAKAESIAAGTNSYPPEFGDHLLQQEMSDPDLKAKLDKKRQEGVKDEDIRWWWNMHDLERRMMVKDDEIVRGAAYLKHTREGMTGEEATREIKRNVAIYGDPEDPSNTQGEHRPLPFELKDRVNIFSIGRMGDLSAVKKEIGEAGSFNALVRKMIREGKL